MAPTIFLLAFLVLQGRADISPMDEYLEKCCSTGGSWAEQSMPCEGLVVPSFGLASKNEPYCRELFRSCCRKAYRKQACARGKADAKRGVSCEIIYEASDDLNESRRNCCKGCKLGILTGSSGKGCTLEKFGLPITSESAFIECCENTMTGNVRNGSRTTFITIVSPAMDGLSNVSSESEEIENGVEQKSNPSLTNNLKSDVDNSCAQINSTVCSQICVPTTESHYCQCYEDYTLEEDGRSCKLNNITSEKEKKAPINTLPAFSTISILTLIGNSSLFTNTQSSSTSTLQLNSIASGRSLDSLNSTKDELGSSTLTSSTSSTSYEPSTTAIGKKSTWSIFPPEISYKMFTTDGKLRTTRSLPTDDNELNLPCPAGYRFNSTTETCDDIGECSELPIPICPPGSECLNAKGVYRCLDTVHQADTDEPCEIGYRWNSTLKRCLDVDECLENIHKCLIDAENCRNLEGSYECEIKCESGFVFNSNFGACLDVNECTELINVCLQPDTICINKLGSFECRSLRDYEHYNEPSRSGNESEDRRSIDYEGFDDVADIDECQVREQPCALGEICRNTLGGYDCIPAGCPRGFVLAADACQDVDECGLGLHSCATHERCQNTNGSFTCEQPRSTPKTSDTEQPSLLCRKGYKVDNKSDTCIDVDECVDGPGCRDYERCRNLQGSYDCLPLCGPGWYFQLQTKTCQDVDECLLGHHNCRQRTQYCRNTNGSYVCEALSACRSGYRRDQNGSCADVDECLEAVHTCSRESHRYCVNREGGYECITRLPSCSRGFEYSLLTRQCEDVDECRSGKASCETRLNERCVNLPGSYKCERPQSGPKAHRQRPACPAGHSYDVAQRKCSDIDECADGTHNCGKQKCYNLPGSFQCSKHPLPVIRRKPSNISEIGIGFVREHDCSIGTRYDKSRGGCVDINECEEMDDACSSNEECTNTPGSFGCVCILGFRRDELTQACVDINECQLGNDCLSSQRCDNTIGSYTCVRFLPCGTGYTLNAATEICEDDDECSLGTHDCQSGYSCRNTLGSYRCDRNRARTMTSSKSTTRRQPRPTFKSTIGALYTTIRVITNVATTPATTTTIMSTTQPATTSIIKAASTTTSAKLTSPKIIDATSAKSIVTYRDPIITSGNITMYKPKITIISTTDDIPTVGTLGTTPHTMKTFVPLRSRINCPRGFESDPFGQCVDIDECRRNLKVCGGQRCTNTIGSYRCESRKMCAIGYAADPITSQCKDINECVQGLHKCGPRQTCENRQGGYICYCPVGYEIGVDQSCADVDECERAMPSRLCGLGGNCTNTPGSYRCDCGLGFEEDPAGGCRDKDECSARPGPCQQECYNTWGGHRCGCRPGYKLRPDNRTCEDVDECSEFKGTSLCVGICDNTPGSYECRCPHGYKLVDDGRTCQDIDECATGNFCKRQGEICQNIRGGFKCNKVECPLGYVNDLQRKNRCVPESPFCSIHDQACLQRPVHYTYNYISIVSMFPIPSKTGQLELFTMRGAYNLVGSTVNFSVAFIGTSAPPHVQPATESCFALRKPYPAQAVLVLTRSLEGPQDIELEFSMEIYGAGGNFAGSAVAKIFITVTQYEF